MPDVIIIGAGVIGTSIGYQLAKLGCRDVLILEKNYIGSGSTEKCAGGIRQQFSSAANVRLSIESVRFFQDFAEETGQTADFRQHGYLMLATTEEDMNTLCTNTTLQRKMGVAVELLSPEEIGKMITGLNTTDILGATFCPSDGYADPYSVVNGFASAAKRLGVKILENTEVTGVILNGNQIRGIVTSSGSYEAPVVVNAAGPYASEVGKMAGLKIPVRPSRRHIFISEPVFGAAKKLPSGLNRNDFPLVVNFHNGFWFRREGTCLIFGMRNINEVEGFDISIDWNFFTDVLAREACHRLPLFMDIGIMRAQAGLHADTPDNMAILGEAPTIKGLYLACGFSGHGFMHSPAIGKLMAELILTGKTTQTDIELFRLERFNRPSEQKETSFI